MVQEFYSTFTVTSALPHLAVFTTVYGYHTLLMDAFATHELQGYEIHERIIKSQAKDKGFHVVSSCHGFHIVYKGFIFCMVFMTTVLLQFS